MRMNSIRFMVGFLIPIVIVFSTAAAVVLSVPDNLPAAAVSNSLSFNEKARWIRTDGALTRCKILVIGSSMALNNIDHEVLARRFGTADIVNAASWSLSFAQAEKMLEVLGAKCHPRLIIWVVYHGDLSDRRSEVVINWDQFSPYINGRNLLLSYILVPDIPYYVRTWWKGNQALRYSRNTYFSLDFDAYGGVNFDCNEFSIISERWNGFSDSAGHIRPLRFQFEAIKSIFDRAKAVAESQQAKIIFVTPPMRQIGESEFHTRDMDQLWEDFSQAISGSQASYIRIKNEGTFPDFLFADYAHLNSCGARKFTEQVIDRIGGDLP
jgi:hypothetical protein